MAALSADPETRIEARLDALTQALRLMIETQNTHGEMLAKLIELATPAEEASPLEESLAEIAAALRDQTAALERIGATMEGIGAEVEAGVMRGLATALEGDDQAEPEAPKPTASEGAD
ncbi:hypothetical protein [Acidiphilium iwatense]|uniref:Uncharacterized protein n=1 Tax=Acidiphilium iwatense TaxID=768198 RepID=A0ABS9E3L8_9PROT|nr:hypothetical protein [Acidiphilium iwatense]MCF3948179.1 hypothetical protein [Acidiphilium iwatense]